MIRTAGNRGRGRERQPGLRFWRFRRVSRYKWRAGTTILSCLGQQWIVVFVIRQRAVLAAGLPTLAGAVTLLILVAMGLGSLLGRAARLATAARRAILIEVGMQNAAQAIAIAASPFLIGDAAYAVPAVVYAVVMNLVLLGYLGWLRAQDDRAAIAKVRA